jgi:preprotein translocase subunit SecG
LVALVVLVLLQQTNMVVVVVVLLQTNKQTNQHSIRNLQGKPRLCGDRRNKLEGSG